MTSALQLPHLLVVLTRLAEKQQHAGIRGSAINNNATGCEALTAHGRQTRCQLELMPSSNYGKTITGMRLSSDPCGLHTGPAPESMASYLYELREVPL